MDGTKRRMNSSPGARPGASPEPQSVHRKIDCCHAGCGKNREQNDRFGASIRVRMRSCATNDALGNRHERVCLTPNETSETVRRFHLPPNITHTPERRLKSGCWRAGSQNRTLHGNRFSGEHAWGTHARPSPNTDAGLPLARHPFRNAPYTECVVIRGIGPRTSGRPFRWLVDSGQGVGSPWFRVFRLRRCGCR